MVPYCNLPNHTKLVDFHLHRSSKQGVEEHLLVVAAQCPLCQDFLPTQNLGELHPVEHTIQILEDFVVLRAHCNNLAAGIPVHFLRPLCLRLCKFQDQL